MSIGTMMTKFGLIRTPRILFGAGQVENLSTLLKKSGTQVLILTGIKSHLTNKGVGKFLSILSEEKLKLHFDRIEWEPTPDDINRIVNRFRSMELNAVVAVGGGSVMDTGKAVSAMLPLETGVEDYLEGVGTKSHPGIKKYFVAIPTTSGTGSEATANAVISGTMNGKGFKRSLRHENFVPDLAIVDPELTLGCPPEITANSGMDAFTQLLESYLSVKSGRLTDALALEGISQVHRCLRRAYSVGEDAGARSGMAYAAMLSGITLANAGLGLVHGFASSVGGFAGLPHGSICGTLMAVVNRFMIEKLLQTSATGVTVDKYVQLGQLLSEKQNKERNWYVRFVADYLDALTEELHISRLRLNAADQSMLEEIAAETDHKNNPVRFEKYELVEMLKSRMKD
jgi:alcohol dehydrogenase class IV